MHSEVKKLLENNADLLDSEERLSTLFLVAANHLYTIDQMLELIIVLESADIKTLDAREKALDVTLQNLFAMKSGKGATEDLYEYLSLFLPNRFGFILDQIIQFIVSHKVNYARWVDIHKDLNNTYIINWRQ